MNTVTHISPILNGLQYGLYHFPEGWAVVSLANGSREWKCVTVTLPWERAFMLYAARLAQHYGAYAMCLE